MIQAITGGWLVMMIFILVATLGMMALIYRSMGGMREEVRRKMSLFPEPPKVSQDVSREEAQRIHGFSVETPKVVTENVEIRKKNIVRVKTIAQKRHEAVLAKLPAVAKMGHEQLKKFFNVQG